MGYREVEKEAEKENRLNKAKRVVKKLRKGNRELKLSFIDISKKVLSTDMDNPNFEDEVTLLHELSKFYELIEPNWRTSFNELNGRKRKYGIEEPIKKDEDVFDLLGGVVDTDTDKASLAAVNMYLANKLAHAYGVARDRIVEDILSKNNVSGNVKDISNYLKVYYKNRFDKNVKAENKVRDKLLRKGITDDIIEQCTSAGVYSLAVAEMHAFSIKDRSMMMAISRFKNREVSQGIGEDAPISFGMKEISENEKLLVVDLPYFGQFSVHMKDPGMISAMSDTIYSKAIYAFESVMLTEKTSTEVSKDIEKMRELIGKEGLTRVDAIRKVAQARVEAERNYSSQDIDEEVQKYAHHLLLKSGAGKKALDSLYDER